MALEVRRLEGDDLIASLPRVAALRIEVFREWPYLYDGDLDYEVRYLAPMKAAPNTVLIGAFDGQTLVGASTAMPLDAHAEDFGAAFTGTGIPMDDVFYCAESVLLPAYRGQGVGHRFFDLREAAGRDYGYFTCAFCAVIRPENHPARPPGFRPLDTFWRARGYAPLQGVIARFPWKDLDATTETEKELQFWARAL